ncbi:MAG: copper-binding protein [Phenylobacterium sp.]|uniref:copper-binding protein n=1 Tax=Phenylobacterium sp. TaxID=1871053 RepID=UPI0025D38E99|nr:copper-binding protein [Phenylobacterium sp.]MBT9470776.1 copper-binding protein [Phenylobacterium sp.]
MKLTLTAALALAVAAPALAQPAGDMKTMPGISGAQGADHTSMTMADGTGVVTAVDAKAGTVTIHHGPIAKLSWPAMTMAFKASPPTLLQGVKVGQSVAFTLMQMGGSTTLTAIQPK